MLLLLFTLLPLSLLTLLTLSSPSSILLKSCYRVNVRDDISASSIGALTNYGDEINDTNCNERNDEDATLLF